MRQSITFPYFLLDRRLLPLLKGWLALLFPFSLLRCRGELDREPGTIGLLAAWVWWSLHIENIGSKQSNISVEGAPGEGAALPVHL